MLEATIVPALETAASEVLGSPPGTFRLVPPKRQIPMLRADYQAMRQMFLSEPRPFDDILMILDEAERSLNV